jgi:hypothetical protein
MSSSLRGEAQALPLIVRSEQGTRKKTQIDDGSIGGHDIARACGGMRRPARPFAP